MKKINLFLTCLTATAFMFTSCNGSGNEEGKSTGNSETEETAAASNEVTIGKQVWMTENLNVDKFRNGDPITEAKTETEWREAGENGKPAWCYYNNNPDNGDRYGKLYNWHAVNDPRGLAPEGWKIPTKDDWVRLIDFLGGAGVTQKKLKSTEYWSDSGNGSNESGFNGLPGGDRYMSSPGTDGMGIHGMWWSSTEKNEKDAIAFRLTNYKVDDLDDLLWAGSKYRGYSVRCLK